MKRRTRTELTIETNELLIIRRSKKVAPAWCPECGEPMVTLEETVAATGISSRMIHRMAEAGNLHFTQTPAGLLLICIDSIPHGGEAAGRDTYSTKAKLGGE